MIAPTPTFLPLSHSGVEIKYEWEILSKASDGLLLLKRGNIVPANWVPPSLPAVAPIPTPTTHYTPNTPTPVPGLTIQCIVYTQHLTTGPFLPKGEKFQLGSFFRDIYFFWIENVGPKTWRENDEIGTRMFLQIHDLGFLISALVFLWFWRNKWLHWPGASGLAQEGSCPLGFSVKLYITIKTAELWRWGITD